MLRYPVDRVISLYHHAMRREKIPARLSLDELVSKIGYHQADNGQVRLLSGQEPEFGSCTRDMLYVARRNLRNYFSAVGLLERFDDSLRLFVHTLAWDGDLRYERAT